MPIQESLLEMDPDQSSQLTSVSYGYILSGLETLKMVLNKSNGTKLILQVIERALCIITFQLRTTYGNENLDTNYIVVDDN